MRLQKITSANFKRAFKRSAAFVMAFAMVLTLLPVGYGNVTAKADPTISITLGNPSNIDDISTTSFSYPNLVVTGRNAITSAVISVTNGTISGGTSVSGAQVFMDLTGTSATIAYSSAQEDEDIQEVLRGLTFTSNSASAPATVKITVDANTTSLPTGATLTAGTAAQGLEGHYYMYVSTQLNWFTAYDTAKTYSFMGMKGYLVTITSSAEDSILDSITSVGAWSGGSRYNNSNGDDSNTYSATSTRNDYFTWACGPEAGTKYYASSTCNLGGSTGVNGAYCNWGPSVGQPDGGGYDTSTGTNTNVQSGESCMQVHFSGHWNDLAYNQSRTDIIQGYFVEFGGYDSSAGSDKTGNSALRASDTNVVCIFNANSSAGDVSIDGATATSKAKAYTYTDTATYGELPSATCQGYEFLGWYTATSGGTRVTTSTLLSAQGTTYRQLYAQWASVEGQIYDSESVTFGGTSASYTTENVNVTVTQNSAAVSGKQITLCDSDGTSKYGLADAGNGTYTAVHTYINNSGSSTRDLSNTADANTYNIYVDGKNTGKTISFASGSNSVALTYKYSTVTFAKDGAVDATLANAVTLESKDASGNTTKSYEMQKQGSGTSTYYEVSVLDGDDAAYHICVDGEDTGYIVSLGQTKTVNYATLTITTTLNGANGDIGAVELRKYNASSELTKTVELTKTATGVYSVTANLADVGTDSYDIYVNDVDTGKDIAFANNAAATVDFATIQVTVQLDGANSTRPVAQVCLSTSGTENNKAVILANNGNGTYSSTAVVASTEYYVWADTLCVSNLTGYGKLQYNATDNKRTMTIPYYSVTYDKNGGTGTIPDASNLFSGNKVTLAGQGNLTKTGKVFSGWLVNDATTATKAGTEITIGVKTTITADWLDGASCEAKWTDEDGTEHYGTLEEAIAAANEETNPVEITVQHDTVIDQSVDFGTNITLHVPTGITLTIEDGVTVTNEGTIINEGNITTETGAGSTGTGSIINNGTLDGSGQIAENGTAGGTGTFAIPITNTNGVIEDGIYTNSVTGGIYRGDIVVQQNSTTGTTGFIHGATSENGGNITVPGGTLTFNDAGVPTNLDAVFGGQATWVTTPAPGHIQVTGDVTLSDPIVITGTTTPSGNAVNVDIDLNSHDIMGAPGEDAIQVSGGTLTVEDNSTTGGGSVMGGDGDATHANGGSGISVSGNANVTLEDDVSVSGGDGYNPGYGNENSTTATGGNGGSGITTTGTGTITVGQNTTVSGGSGGSSNGGDGGDGGTAIQVSTGGNPTITISGTIEGGNGGGARGFDDSGNLVGTGGDGGTGIETTSTGVLSTSKLTTTSTADVTGGQGGMGSTSGATGSKEATKETSSGTVTTTSNTRTAIIFTCDGASENASFTLYKEGDYYYDAETGGNRLDVLDKIPQKAGTLFKGYYFEQTVGGQTEKVNVVNPDGTWISVSEKFTALIADMAEDSTAPTGEIFVDEDLDSDSSTQIISPISFSHITTSAKTVTITASDNGMATPTIYYYLSAKELSETELKASTISWTKYTDAFTESPTKPCNKFVVYAKIVDAAGNTTYLSSDGYQVATTDAQVELYSEDDLDQAIALELTNVVLKSNITVSKDTNLTNGMTLDTGNYTLTVASNVTLTSTGTISGKVVNQGTTYGGSFSGNVTNSGTMKSPTVQSTGSITGGTVEGTVSNAGTIADASITGTVDNDGTIKDASITGTVDNAGGTIDSTSGKKTTITSTASVTGGTLKGTVENKGAVTNATITGTVDNNGTIIDASITGTVDNTDGKIQNTTDGQTTISSTASVTGGSVEGTVDNDGTITNASLTGTVDNDGTIKGANITGTVDNAGGTIDSSADKITTVAETASVTGGTVKGSVDNNGIITDATIKGTVDNADGKIKSTDDGKTTISSTASVTGGSVEGTVDNDGTITDATIKGMVDNAGGKIESTDGNQITISETASVTGGTVTGAVDNDGTIAGASVSGTVDNDGTITDASITGTVDNAGGTITSTSGQQTSLANNTTVTGGTIKGTVDNNGTITDATIEGTVDNAGGKIESTDGNQITISETASVTGGTVTGTVDNDGTIAGASVSGTVDNDGTIKDASVSGTVDNAGGTITSTSGQQTSLADNTTVTGGTIDGTVDNNGTLVNTTITGTVDNTDGTVESVTPSGSSSENKTVISNTGKVTDGTLYGNIENEGTIYRSENTVLTSLSKTDDDTNVDDTKIVNKGNIVCDEDLTVSDGVSLTNGVAASGQSGDTGVTSSKLIVGGNLAATGDSTVENNAKLLCSGDVTSENEDATFVDDVVSYQVYDEGTQGNEEIKIGDDEKVYTLSNSDSAGLLTITVKSTDEDGNDSGSTILNDLTVSTVSQIIASCMDDDEIEDVQSGEYDMEIQLVVTTLDPDRTIDEESQEGLTEAEKEALEEQVEQQKTEEQQIASTIASATYAAQGYAVGNYFDVTLEKRTLVDGEVRDDWEKIPEPEEMIDITIEIPAALRANNRVYAVMRNHTDAEGNSKCDLLTNISQKNNYITFRSNLFSTYAIVYYDVVEVEVVPNNTTTLKITPPKTDDPVPSSENMPVVELDALAEEKKQEKDEDETKE